MSATPKKTAAQLAEVTGEPIEFEFNGVTYAVKPSSKWKGKSFRFAENQQMFAFLESVLVNPEQSELVDEMEQDEMLKFFSALGEASGTGNL